MEIKRYTKQELESMHITKNDLFKDFDHVFDFALPQIWLDRFSRFASWSDINYRLIVSTTVWIYPENIPVSRCVEVQDQINQFLKYTL